MSDPWELVWTISSDSQDARTIEETLGISPHETINMGDRVTDDLTGIESIFPYTLLSFGSTNHRSGKHIQTGLHDTIDEIQPLKGRLKKLTGPYRLDLHCYLRTAECGSVSLQFEQITLLNEVGAGFFISVTPGPSPAATGA